MHDFGRFYVIFFVFSPRKCGVVARFERWIRCSLLEHCLQQKTLRRLTEHRVTEEGDEPIYNPSFYVLVSRATHAHLSVIT